MIWRIILICESKEKDKQEKKSACKDKRKFINEMANLAEDAAKRGVTAKVYKITKKLCGKNLNKSKPVKDKEGRILSSEVEQGKVNEPLSRNS